MPVFSEGALLDDDRFVLQKLVLQDSFRNTELWHALDTKKSTKCTVKLCSAQQKSPDLLRNARKKSADQEHRRFSEIHGEGSSCKGIPRSHAPRILGREFGGGMFLLLDDVGDSLRDRWEVLQKQRKFSEIGKLVVFLVAALGHIHAAGFCLKRPESFDLQVFVFDVKGAAVKMIHPLDLEKMEENNERKKLDLLAVLLLASKVIYGVKGKHLQEEIGKKNLLKDESAEMFLEIYKMIDQGTDEKVSEDSILKKLAAWRKKIRNPERSDQDEKVVSASKEHDSEHGKKMGSPLKKRARSVEKNFELQRREAPRPENQRPGEIQEEMHSKSAAEALNPPIVKWDYRNEIDLGICRDLLRHLVCNNRFCRYDHPPSKKVMNPDDCLRICIGFVDGKCQNVDGTCHYYHWRLEEELKFRFKGELPKAAALGSDHLRRQ